MPAAVKNEKKCELQVDDRDSLLKWNGWGFKDSFFYVDDDGRTIFRGTGYETSGQVFPDLTCWMQDTINSTSFHYDYGKEGLDSSKIPASILNERLIKFLDDKSVLYSLDSVKRAHRSHGHTIEDMIKLRLGECQDRIPDVIIWPSNHQEVVDVVNAANEMDFVIIPIGGGTSVSSALKCPKEERRCIVSLDVGKMNKILWVDEKNLLAKAECGILGAKLEKQLNEKGYTLGHEPDSIEFSSLGGWVATRASGIKKNKYGNIEDILVHVSLVTPSGVVQKSCVAPRVSTGPDIHHFVIGSEGTLGVITEVTFKICHLPECKKFGSILFPTFEHGVKAMREVARQRIAPASMRLMDNDQFRFGQALKPIPTFWSNMLKTLKMLYVTKWKGFDPRQMAPATLVFEGAKREVDLQEKRVYEIAAKFGGFAAGAENGRNGYMLTFAIAYLRDFAMDYMCIGESFETSAPWEKITDLCRNVKELCRRECVKRGVKQPPYVSCRVTQLYDAGACIYFYFGFNYQKLDPLPNETPEDFIRRALHIYEEIEELARMEILSHGGSLSHHHGVGKIRKRWMPQTVGAVGLSALRAVKQSLDPKNIFACGNLFTASASKL